MLNANPVKNSFCLRSLGIRQDLKTTDNRRTLVQNVFWR
ncbi:uncharacterized protein METZ01_LOCUS416527 [marine metagenome]|uniref:Uncharacterized protein n=1 Tax=marine metagenome TaxID=408172 RepID=A0A382WY75_9ZZZZ